MISCTLIIYQQFQYLEHADTGIDKDQIVSVPLHEPDKGRETVEKLRTMLASDPHIVSITGSNINLGKGADHRTVKIGTNFTYHGRSVNTNIASIDYDYLKTLGVRPVEGREFDQSFGTDTAGGVLISATMAAQLGEKDPVGKVIGDDSSAAHWHVVGVFHDFHLYTMAEKQEPLTLTLEPHASIPYCFIKTSRRDPMRRHGLHKKSDGPVGAGPGFQRQFRGREYP